MTLPDFLYLVGLLSLFMVVLSSLTAAMERSEKVGRWADRAAAWVFDR